MSGADDQAPPKLRVTEEFQDTPMWRNFRDRLTRLGGSVDVLASECKTLLELLDEAFPEKRPQQIDFLTTEFRAQRGRLQTFANALAAFLDDQPGVCRWLELRRRTNRPPSLELHAAPIDVAPSLERSLFEPFQNRHDDIRHPRCRPQLRPPRARGWGSTASTPPERTRELLIESPFDFAKQAALLCPADLPPPGSSGYERASHEAMQLGLRLAGGGTFVLMTSYSALQRAHDNLKAA